MLITRVSPVSGKTNSKEIDVTQEQLDSYLVHGEFIQKAMPHLSPADREFILSGITEEEWDDMFKDMEDE